MDVEMCDPVGAIVRGTALDDLDESRMPWLRGLLAHHGVVVLRDQNTDDDGFVAFLRRLGELAFTVGETPVPGCPDLNLVSNVGRDTAPRSTFHVDTSYVARPPAYTALRAVRIPERGGHTLFSDQRRAYDTLGADVRDRLVGRTLRHVVTGLDLGPDEETAAEHPLVRSHPVTGRPVLYLTTPARCAAISGIDDHEARDIIAALYDHSTTPANVYRHRWVPGDVVLWDNGCVMHRADHDGVIGDRVLHRGMVGAYGPAAVVAR